MSVEKSLNNIRFWHTGTSTPARIFPLLINLSILLSKKQKVAGVLVYIVLTKEKTSPIIAEIESLVLKTNEKTKLRVYNH